MKSFKQKKYNNETIFCSINELICFNRNALTISFT